MVTANQLSQRACPVCGGGNSKLLFEQHFEQLSGAQLLDGYNIVVCRDCGAAFADRIPEQAVFDDYYREFSKYEGGEPEAAGPPETEKRFEDAASFVAGFIPSLDAPILEIGCGFGQFLWVLRQRGFSNLLGADPSPGCARAARKFYDIYVTDRTIFTLERPETPYEFLTLIGVMEHIRDLDRTIERFHELLSPTGRVYLEVPDASRLDPGMDAPFQEFSVEHLNYFSPLSLNNLMTQRGFRVVASGRALRRLHEVEIRTAYGVYERSPEPAGWVKDDETEPGLSAYVEGCRGQDAQLREKIRRAIPEGRRILVWGVGAHTLRLLATRGLEVEWVEAFVDSNSKYQQRDLRGVRVISPAEVRPGPQILISSRGFQREIHDQIRNRLGLANPVILLYDSV
jgi:SAM-dependent methyltransferase